MSTPISALHQAALDYIADGIPVFPCLPGGKEPAVKRGFYAATTKRQVIDAWWTDNPQYNIGIVPENNGWSVIDEDIGAEPLDLPPTFTIKTRSGTFHHYFNGSLPPTTGKLAHNVCTRGYKSYVLVPPSYVDGAIAGDGISGSYTVELDVDVAPLPEWISRWAQRHIENQLSAPDTSLAIELDQPAAIERAKKLLADWVHQGKVAIEGAGGDNLAFQGTCELLDLGLSPERAHALLLAEWNPYCIPEWGEDELAVKVANAARYHQNNPGAWAVGAPAEAFDRRTLEAAGVGRKSRFYFDSEAEMEHVKEVGWLIPGILPRESTVLLYGLTGSLKSFLALEWALSVAYGVPTCGHTPEPGLVFYCAAEGRASLKGKRRKAWQIARDQQHASGRFFVGRTPLIINSEWCTEFEEQIAERAEEKPVALIVLDTLAKTMIGLDESKTRDAGMLVAFADKLVERFRCVVLVLHHEGKDQARGARGSSSLPAGFDTILRVETNRETKALALYVVQHKDAEEPAHPFTWEAKPLAGSLVLFPTDAEAHKLLTAPQDKISPDRVGKALRKLGAIDADKAVATQVLATELTKEGAASPEDHLLKTNRAARVLRRLAKESLIAYTTQLDRQAVWHLPTLEKPG